MNQWERLNNLLNIDPINVTRGIVDVLIDFLILLVVLGDGRSTVIVTQQE